MMRTNKQGQALGRKGAESRARLLEAAHTLLQTLPAEKLTASSIARAAGLASQTLYLYFADVDELLLSLVRHASFDMHEVMAALDGPWDPARAREQADRLVAAFYAYWDRNRAVLNIRNFRADSGQTAFLQLRNEGTMPVVARLAGRMRDVADDAGAGGAGAISERAALSRAIIIVAAIERMASRYANIEAAGVVDADDLRSAEADILMLMLPPLPG